MPFALIVMTEPHNGPLWLGPAAAMLAFVLVGAGMHMVQTAGLALATDLASTETRPRVVALLYVMLLLGMIIASIGFAHLLQTFDYIRLIKVLQGAAMLSLVLNVVALWKQEPRNPERTRHDRVRPAFTSAWRDFLDEGRNRRLLVALAMGTMGFAMQDVLLEPYGAQILGLSVASTTQLTALFAVGMLMAFAWASRSLAKGRDPIRIAGTGGVLGVFAFATVIFSAPLESSALFRLGTVGIGLGHGLFAYGRACDWCVGCCPNRRHGCGDFRRWRYSRCVS
jgi:BCD family chlorophyll transporter-like MFS transporter